MIRTKRRGDKRSPCLNPHELLKKLTGLREFCDWPLVGVYGPINASKHQQSHYVGVTLQQQ